MKTSILVIIGLAALIVTGCLAPASKINAVSIGMNRVEVIKVMGDPVSVTADTNGVTFLNYNLAEVPTYFDVSGTPYTVEIQNDRVIAFGRTGSAPEQRQVPVIVTVPGA